MSEPVLNPVAVDDSIPGPVASPPPEAEAEAAPSPEPDRPSRRPAFGREMRIAMAVALSVTTLAGVLVVNHFRGTKGKDDKVAEKGQEAPKGDPRRQAPAVQIPTRTPSAAPNRAVAEAPPRPAPAAKPKPREKDDIKVVDHPPAPVEHESSKPHDDETTTEPAVAPPAAAEPAPAAIVETTKEESRTGEVAALDPPRNETEEKPAGNDPPIVTRPQDTAVTAPDAAVEPAGVDPKPETTPEPKAVEGTGKPVADPKENEPIAGPITKPSEAPKEEDPLPAPAEVQAPAPTTVVPKVAAEPHEPAAPATIEAPAIAGEASGDWVTLPNRRSSARTEPRVAAMPSPAPAEEPAGDDGGPIRHTVRRGENFWTLAKTYYGSGRFYKALWAANRDQVAAPEALEVGMTIKVPMPEALDPALIEPAKRAAGRSKPAGRPRAADDEPPPVVAGRPRPTPTAILEDDRPAPRSWSRLDHPTHRVRSGENLRTIARDYLGDSLREDEIADLNPDLVTDPPRVPVGTLLRLPDDAHASRPRGKGMSDER